MNLSGSTEGRWMTPDLLGGDITNPQSLNRYAYALNNPTTLTDPLGLDPPGLGGGIGECSFFGCVPNCSIFTCGPFPFPPIGPIFPPIGVILGSGGTGGGGSSGSVPPPGPGAPPTGRPPLSGDVVGPSGPLSLWQLFGPINGYPCDFGTCGGGYPSFISGATAAEIAIGGVGEGICIIAEPCGTGEAVLAALLFAVANSQGHRPAKFNGKYPGNDPKKSPGPGWEWRGPGPVGSKEGGWYEPSTHESLHPDLQNALHGPHWDYVDPSKNQFWLYPDGSIVPKQ